MSAGVRHVGHKAIQKAYTDDLKTVRFSDSKTVNATSRIFGDTAIVSFNHQFKVHFAKEGSHWQVHIRTSTVLNRKNGKWKIVQEHSSPIRGIDRYTEIKRQKTE